MSAEAFFESEHVKYIRHLHINGFDYVIRCADIVL